MSLFAIEIRMPVLIAGLAIIVALLIYGIISAIKEKGKPNPMVEKLERDAQNDIIIEETHGVICKMECGTTAGGRYSSTKKNFYIVFRDDFGNEKGFHVNEETYLALDTDIPGILYTTSGSFYGFGYDEEPESDMEADGTVTDVNEDAEESTEGAEE